MIPSEVESLQDQLTQGSLEVEEFFAVILSNYEFDDSKEIYSTLTNLSQISSQTNSSHVLSVQMYRNCSLSMCSHILSAHSLYQFLLN